MNNKLHILVVDDDHSMARTLVDILRAKGYEAEAAHSGPEALEKIAQDSFDCILSDVDMPGISGVELYRAIKARQPDLPVVLMTAYSTDGLVKEGLEEGAMATVTKPLDINALFSFFSALSRERSIVNVDDNPEFGKILGEAMRERGFTVSQMTDPHGVVERIRTEEEVVLLDMKLKDTNGLEVLKGIRERYPHLPVILVTGYREEMAQAIEAALKIDAYACLYKPFQLEELLELLKQVHHQQLSRILGT